jgi:hypothetical protein
MVTAAAQAVPPSSATRAQATTVDWARPIQLSDDTGETFYPTVAVDLAGNAHAFWAQGEPDSKSADSIYHTEWNGASWTMPRDVFAAAKGEWFNYPDAAVDASGVFHLVWASGSGINYSSTAAANAHDVKAWAPPQLIAVANTAGAPSIAVSPNGVLHVTFTQRLPGTNVEYLQSVDGGQTWSEPVSVSRISPSEPQVPDLARIAVDSQGRVHLAWSENHPPTFVSRRVYVTSSEDGGNSWLAPTDLSDAASDQNWNASIDLTVDHQDRVNVVWTCGRDPNRCYRRSADYGHSWSSAEHLFGNLLGLSGWDALVADSYGNIYWLGPLRYPAAVYASILKDDRWVDPPQVVIEGNDLSNFGSMHFPQIAIGRGNEIHLVVIRGDTGPVWYMRGTTSEPLVQAAPTAIPAVVPTLGAVIAAPTVIPVPVQQVSVSQSVAVADSSTRIFLWSLLPVLALLLVAAGWISLRRRR